MKKYLILLLFCFFISNVFGQIRIDSLKIDEKIFLDGIDRMPFFQGLNDSNQVGWDQLTETVKQQVGAAVIENAPDDVTLEIKISGPDTTIGIKSAGVESAAFAPSAITAIGDIISDSISFPQDTSALKLLDMEEGKLAYLERLSDTNPFGSGLFVVRRKTDLIVMIRDSTANSVTTFTLPTLTLLWVRVDYLNYPKEVNILWAGAMPDSSVDASASYTRARGVARTIIFPAGVYKIQIGDSTDYVKLIGLGSGGHRDALSDSTGVLFIPPDGSRDITSGIHVSLGGNYAEAHNISMHGKDSLYIGLNLADRTGDSKISNIKIRNYVGPGLQLDSSFASNVEKVTSTRNGYGLKTIFQCANSVFTGCSFTQNSIRSLYMNGGLSISFITCDFATQTAFADTAIEILNASNISFYSMYGEYDTDADDRVIYLRTDTPTANLEVSLYNTRIAVSNQTAPIDVTGPGKMTLNVYGGDIGNFASYPILAGDSLKYNIDIHNTRLTKAGPGGIPRKIYGYDSDNYIHVSSSDEAGKMEFMGEVLFVGSGGIIDGIRTDGLGQSDDPNRSVLNKRISDVITSATDTTQLYIEFPAKNVTGNYSVMKGKTLLKFQNVAEGNTSHQLFVLNFWQLGDGSSASMWSFTIDTLANYLTASQRLDSIYVSTRTDSSFIIDFIPNPSHSGTRYLSGTISGENIGSGTTLRAKP